MFYNLYEIFSFKQFCEIAQKQKVYGKAKQDKEMREFMKLSNTDPTERYEKISESKRNIDNCVKDVNKELEISMPSEVSCINFNF